MKKIVHLSDLHVGYDNCGDNFATIVKKISQQLQPASDFVIVITGDIVDQADEVQSRALALDRINVLKQIGFRVLVAPGNHDYGTGICADKKYVAQFKREYFGDETIEYPKLDLIDNMAFIALDSNAEELHWYDRFFAEGEVGKEQLCKLKSLLNSEELADKKIIVYLHHHPIKWRFGLYLKDRKKLLAIVKNRVDALLFGHIHDKTMAKEDSFCGQYGISRIYNAGSSTHKEGDPGKQRIIDLAKSAEYDIDGAFV